MRRKPKKRKINLKDKLWRIFSAYIRKKYSNDAGWVSCVTCGELRFWKDMSAGHYHPRTDGLSLYFDEQNVHPQCNGCNMFRSGNLTRYAIYLRKTYGDGILEELDRRRRLFRKISTDEYEQLIQEYKEKADAFQLPESWD